MAWFKVDDGFHSHPKVLDLSPSSIGIWALMGSWSAGYLTDGCVRANIIERFGGTSQNIAELVDSGLWIDNGDGTYQFKDWDEYQPKKVDIEAEREAARERMRLVRARKKGVTKGVDSSENVRANNSRSSEEVRVTPSQSHPIPLTEEAKASSMSEVSVETPRPDVERILEAVEHHCRQHDLKKPNRTKQNLAAARLLIDRDGYTVDQVLWIMTWVSASEFWASNIRSPQKLREKFDRLKHQATRQTSSGTSRPSPAATRQAETVAMIQELQAEENARQTTPRSEGSIMGEIL